MKMDTKQYKFVGDDFKIDQAPTKVAGFDDQDEAMVAEVKEKIAANLKKIKKFQKKMYSRSRYGVVLVFQALDAAGKDSMIAHIFSGVDPVGFTVNNFKQPSKTDLAHDYLWRVHEKFPERGDIGILNRSYYEDVLVSYVHPELILNAKLPNVLTLDDVDEKFWAGRYEDIRQFEKYMTRNGYVVLKFFLHVSKEEQKKRFKRRIEMPEKNWKFSASDIAERQFFDQYQVAYEKAINATATKKNPWYVIPSDSKWYSRLVVSDILTKRLDKLDLSFPEVTAEQKAAMQVALQKLENEPQWWLKKQIKRIGAELS